MSDTLRGLCVWVTRAVHQAEGLVKMLEERGAEVLKLPLLQIEPAGDPDQLRARLAAAAGCDWWIFTSANAVAHAAALAPAAWGKRRAAIGPATAAALAEQGHPADVSPESEYSSEALLAIAEFQALAGQHVLLVTGEDARELLPEVLRERGAEVEILPVYRRAPEPLPPAQLEQAVTRAQAIVITSGDALELLLKSMPDALAGTLRQKQLLVPGRRVLEQAKLHGFATPALVPEQMSDASIVRRLEDWRATAHTASPMSEPQPDPAPTPSPSPVAAPPPPSRPAPRRDRGWLPWVVVVLLAAGLGFGVWWLQQSRVAFDEALGAQVELLAHTQRELSATQAQIGELESQQAALTQALRRQSADLNTLSQRLGENAEAISELAETVQGGRAAVRLAAVEELLLLANERLLMGRDVNGALKALTLADQGLAELREPRLFEVRQAIADEQAALRAVPQADVEAASLSLASLISRAGELPLRARVPAAFTQAGQAPGATGVAEDAPWPQRLWGALRAGLASVFAIRRTDTEMPRLLPPEQEALVHHLLALRLESARVALLRREGASYRSALGAAGDWLQQQFNIEHPGVASALAEIERLRRSDLAPPLPDITQSLALLRARVDGGGAPAAAQPEPEQAPAAPAP